MNLFQLAAVFALLAGSSAQSLSVTDENEGSPYGVDCSFPIQNKVRKRLRGPVDENYNTSCFAFAQFFVLESTMRRSFGKPKKGLRRLHEWMLRSLWA